MSLVDPERIKPLQDNLLVILDMHANAQQEEKKTKGGLFIPKSADDGANADHGETVPAVIVAAGPGRWTDTFRDQEKGSVPYGDGFWLPMNPLLKPGTRVMVDSPDQGDKVYARDKAKQYRLVREENIVMLWDGEDWKPLGDCVVVAPDHSEQMSEGGIILPEHSAKNKPTEGEVLAVGPGKRVPLLPGCTCPPNDPADLVHTLNLNCPIHGTEVRRGGNPLAAVARMRKREIMQHRPLSIHEGDRVIYGKFAGHKMVLDDVELLLLREESVLAVVGQENRREYIVRQIAALKRSP